MRVSRKGADGLHIAIAHNIGAVHEAKIDFARLSVRTDGTDLIGFGDLALDRAGYLAIGAAFVSVATNGVERLLGLGACRNVLIAYGNGVAAIAGLRQIELIDVGVFSGHDNEVVREEIEGFIFADLAVFDHFIHVLLVR